MVEQPKKRTDKEMEKLSKDYLDMFVRAYSHMYGELAVLQKTLPENVARELGWQFNLIGDGVLNCRKYGRRSLFFLDDKEVEAGAKEMEGLLGTKAEKTEPDSDFRTDE